MKARFEVAVALMAAILLLAACGSSSSSSTTNFKQGYSAVRTQFTQTSMAIGAEIRQAPTQTDTQIATQFHTLAVRWQSGLNQLHTLTPPANVASDFNTLNSSATRVETDLNSISTAAGNHDAATARQSAMSLVTNLTTAQAASRSIDNKIGLK